VAEDGYGALPIERLENEPPPNDRRRRTPCLVVLAAVVGGLVGWSLRSTPGTNSTATPTTIPAATTPTSTISTATTPSSTASATTVVAPVEILDAGASLLPVQTGLELFARSTSGDVVRIEVDRGRVTRTSAPAIGSSAPTFMVVGADRVVFRPLDNVAGYVVPDGGGPQQLEGELTHGTFGAFPASDPQHLWLTGDNDNLVLVGFDGTPTNVSIPIPGAFPWGPAGTGRVLVEDTGGVYLVGPDGPIRVTGGKVLAAGPTRWLTLECDERLVCTMMVIERATGERHFVGPAKPDPALGPGGVLSPDGRYASFLRSAQGAYQLHLVDLATAEDRPITDVSASADFGLNTMVWSPDSRFFFYVDRDSHLRALDVDTGETRTLLPDFLLGDQLGSRDGQ
jgi:hypothetical protein